MFISLKRHYARVKELLAANNAELERRRNAERNVRQSIVYNIAKQVETMREGTAKEHVKAIGRAIAKRTI